jgi:hypothetical protein
MAERDAASPEQVESKRERSTIEFPYLDQDDAAEIAKAIHTTFGTSCQREQLAAQLQVSATGGGFNLRLGTAKMYGFLNHERGTVTLTDLGLRVADPQQEKAARAESFLSVPLYKALFETFNGKALPSTSSGLETEMVKLGVSPKQKDRARQVFQRSAKQAGFFWSGNDRLVLPAPGKYIARMTGEAEKEVRDEKSKEREREREQQPIYPHFIQGLLQKLPKEGSEWAKEERAKWLQLAALAFDIMYVDKASGSAITVEFKKGGPA